MIVFWLVAALLLAATLAVLLKPLLRQADPETAEGEPVGALFRQQLAELEADLAQDRLEASEAEAARTEITRRMLAEADRQRQGTTAGGGGRGDRGWRFATVVGLAALLPAGALAVYYTVGAPSAITGVPTLATAAIGPHSAADLATAVIRLQARVKQVPGDLNSWIMLGRTLAALGRFEPAEDAFHHAVALAPTRPELHAELGEVLVLAAEGRVTPAAQAEFAKAPKDPRSRFYEAEADAQRGDIAGAKKALQALLADAPADASWRKIVVQGLAQLAPAQPQPSPGSPAAEAGRIPGPSPADVAAARAMTPEQRAAMIRGMVARLAARMEKHPDDREGWLRLAHAYEVIGAPQKAKAARARAAAAGMPAAPAAAAAPAPPADPAAMVAKLAARLAQQPDDVAGWLMLARSYRVLGREGDALAALRRANQHVPGNLVLLQHYLAALAAGLKDGQPSPELVDVAGRINALDAKEPDALWYLGLAARARGDRFAAAKYWTTLAAELPAGGSERRVVQQKLDSLR
jgi:cytochrome c-type biogenesis protein CcmH